MKKNLGKKARISFSPMEKEYNARFGMFPDYHYDELYEKYGHDAAEKTVQKNMDKIWADIKERESPTFHAVRDSPFVR